MVPLMAMMTSFRRVTIMALVANPEANMAFVILLKNFSGFLRVDNSFARCRIMKIIAVYTSNREALIALIGKEG